MGNSISSDIRRNRKISSIDNLKQQMGYLDEKHSKKKKNLIFTAVPWKRLFETTKKKGVKQSKSIHVNGAYQETLHSKGVHPNLQHFTDAPSGKTDKKSQSLYDVNKKQDGAKDVRQQPFTATRPTDVHHSTEGFKRQPPHQLERLQANAGKQQTSARGSLNQRQLQPNQMRSNRVSGQQGRKLIIQASTSELLDCLGQFVCRRCPSVTELDPSDIPTWLRGVDRALLKQGWQDLSFIMPSSVVFVYMLCREMLHDGITSVFEIQCIVLTCLYMSYSYMGNEISYPLRPFLIERERYAFWERCCRIMNKLSGKMLRINKDAQFFTSVFRDLKVYSPHSSTPSSTYSRTLHNRPEYLMPASRSVLVN